MSGICYDVDGLYLAAVLFYSEKDQRTLCF